MYALAGLIVIATAQAEPPQRPQVVPGSGPAIPGRGAPTDKGPDQFTVLNQAEFVFVAKIANVKYGAVAQSLPPIYFLTISFEEGKFMKGQPPEKLSFGYHKRQLEKPVFDLGRPMLVAASRPADKSNTQLQIAFITPANNELLKTAKAAAALPLGWKLDGEQAISPWAKLGEDAWPRVTEVTSMLRCSKSDRPGLLVGPGIALSVEQVIPKEVVEFHNPYGDGEFKVTVANTSDQQIEIPALLTDGKHVLWSNSLIIINGEAALLPPTAKKLTAVQSVALDPGESVSGIIIVRVPIAAVFSLRRNADLRQDFPIGHEERGVFFRDFRIKQAIQEPLHWGEARFVFIVECEAAFAVDAKHQERGVGVERFDAAAFLDRQGAEEVDDFIGPRGARNGGGGFGGERRENGDGDKGAQTFHAARLLVSLRKYLDSLRTKCSVKPKPMTMHA